MNTHTLSATTRRTLQVPALGLSERAVFEELGLTWREVHPLYGHEIGAPRDYVARRHGTIFTAEGVRRLVAHFGLPVDISAETGNALGALGAHVRRLRRESNLTQETLAELAAIDPTYVQRIERGQGNVSLSILVRLSQALGINLSTLVRPVDLAP
jgi:DNA-binding XRE family transcriptional regulator